MFDNDGNCPAAFSSELSGFIGGRMFGIDPDCGENMLVIGFDGEFDP